MNAELTNEVAHTCPVCTGAGHVWRPPWIPGDQATWMATRIESYPCRACDGTGIVWTTR